MCVLDRVQTRGQLFLNFLFHICSISFQPLIRFLTQVVDQVDVTIKMMWSSGTFPFHSIFLWTQLHS